MKINNNFRPALIISIIAVISILSILPAGSAEAKTSGLTVINNPASENIKNTQSGFISVTSSAIVPPANLEAVYVSSSQVTLLWEDMSDNELRFNIERRTGKSSFFLINTVGVNVTTYNDTGLNPGSTYYYRVSAIGLGGSVAYSNDISVTTQLTPVQPPVLYWPGNGYIVTSLTPLIQWSEPENAVTYDFQVATDAAFNNFIINETELDLPYYDVPKSVFKWYSYYYWRVRAIDADGIATGWSATSFFRVYPESLLLPFFCGCGG